MIDMELVSGKLLDGKKKCLEECFLVMGVVDKKVLQYISDRFIIFYTVGNELFMVRDGVKMFMGKENG